MLKVAKLEVVDEPRTLPPESESHLDGTVREVAPAWKDRQNLPGMRKQQEGGLVLGHKEGGRKVLEKQARRAEESLGHL